MGTQLSDALISTRNRAAFIAESGGYGRVTCASERWQSTQKRVNFRFGIDEAVLLFRSNSLAQLGLPDALGCYSGDGQIIHLIQVRTWSDLSIINALELSSLTPDQPCLDVPLSDDIIPFGPIMGARGSWDQAGMVVHLCDLLSDRGRIRQKCLAHVGRNRAWRILTSILPSFLTFLKDRRFPLVRGVLNCELLQSCGGDIHHVEQCDNLLI